MPRRPGQRNRTQRVEHQPIRHKKRTWHYDGRLDPIAKQLVITKVHGEISGHASELNEAIKAECVRTGCTVYLDDEAASGALMGAVKLALPWEVGKQ